jgi:hypothetical protein
MIWIWFRIVTGTWAGIETFPYSEPEHKYIITVPQKWIHPLTYPGIWLHLAHFDKVPLQLLLPQLLVLVGLVHAKVHLELDVAGKDVGEEGPAAQLLLRDLEGVALVLAILGEGHADLVAVKVEEGTNNVVPGKLLAVLLEGGVVHHLALGAGVGPGAICLTCRAKKEKIIFQLQ